jgi:fumarylacetoacetase
MTRHDLTTWVDGAHGSLHDIDHLPYAVVASEDPAVPTQVGVRIGDRVLLAGQAARALRPEWEPLLVGDSINALMAAGPDTWGEVRSWLQTLLSHPACAADLTLRGIDEVRCLLPFEVADYVDYYASIDHATNVGRMFRPDGEPLLPNWRHLPVAYHGRAGSIVVSGTDVVRPCGQRRGADGGDPVFGPSLTLDIEAELGFVVGRSVPHGTRVGTTELDRTVFGVVGVNDWSARDLQAWEYVPLGPNLGKSFATSVSAWVTPLAALEHARVPGPEQRPDVLPYLQDDGPHGLDVSVEVELNGHVVARPPYASMYWSPAQMLAHLTVNGAALRVGDLFASGTISGPRREERGSFLELSWAGAEPFAVGDGRRTFLEDGDEVVLRYLAPTRRGRLALGEVRGRIVPAIDDVIWRAGGGPG